MSDIIRKLFLSITSIVFLFVLSSSTETNKYDDKLFACVNKIIRLVEWDSNPNVSVFEIGFMGDQHLYNLTRIFFRGKTYKEKPIKVTHYLTLEQLKSHSPKALYIGKHKHDIGQLTKICNEKHIFSISDDQTHRDNIPLVLLHVHEDLVDIIVNKTEAEKQSFKISYHLLRAAKEVK